MCIRKPTMLFYIFVGSIFFLDFPLFSMDDQGISEQGRTLVVGARNTHTHIIESKKIRTLLTLDLEDADYKANIKEDMISFFLNIFQVTA